MHPSNSSEPLHPSLEILQTHPLPFWIVDPSFSILFANKAAQAICGCTTEQLNGYSLLSFVQASGLSVLNQAIEITHIANGSVALVAAKDGSTTEVQFLTSACSRNEHLLHITAVPLHSSAEVLQTTKRYKAYIDQSPAGIYCCEFGQPIPVHATLEEVVDILKGGRITECNKAMANMYGLQRPEDLLSKPLAALLDFDDPHNIEYLRSFIGNGFCVEDAESHEIDSHGHSVYFLNNAIGIIEDGFVKQVWGTQRDITSIRKSERHSRLLAEMVQESSDILTAADLEFKPITWSKTAEQVYGLKAEEVIGKELSSLIQIFYNNASRQEVRRSVYETGEWRGEMYFIRPGDQELVTLLASFKLILDEAGKPAYVISSATDITQRKQAEIKLRESESRFREAADTAPVMIWMYNEKGICTYVNPQWVEFTGSDPVFSDGSAWESLVHPEDLAYCKSVSKQFEESRKPFDLVYRLRTKSGNYRWVKDVCVPRYVANNFVGFIGSVIDIDDQKKTEQQLRFQATILENISDIVTSVDLEFNIIGTNKAGEEAYGYTNEEMRGGKMSNFIQFTFYNSSLQECAETLRTKGYWEGEVSFVKKDGTECYFLHSVKELFDEQNRKIGYLSIGKDITERRKMEQAIQQSELFYRTLIADSANGTLLLNEAGEITFASAGVTTLLGYTPEEIVGTNSFNYVNASDLTWAQESFTKELEANPQIKSITIRVRKKNGEWLWCMCRGHNLLSNPHVRSMVIYFHDDTVRKQANDALKQSEKRFRSLISELTVGLFMVSEEGDILLCNPMLCKMLNKPEQEIVGKNVRDFLNIPVVDESGVSLPIEKMPVGQLLSGSVLKDFVVGVQHPLTKEKSWIMFNSKPITDDTGRFLHAICMMRDVTAQKEREKKNLEQNIRHQRQLTQATIDGQEKERREMGRELHDNIGQQLTTVKLFLDMLKNNVSEEGAELMQLALKGINDVINEVRAMSRSLVPYTLKDLGLVESISELIDSLQRTQSLQVYFEHSGFDDSSIPENQQLTIFRIVQEQMNNICKHANASSATIQLQLKSGQILLNISDNGRGFNIDTVRKGLGLANMRNRAELFGGKVSIISEEGYGTLMSVSIPFRAEEMSS
jgi:PAS domain S-box-containing protein